MDFYVVKTNFPFIRVKNKTWHYKKKNNNNNNNNNTQGEKKDIGMTNTGG